MCKLYVLTPMQKNRGVRLVNSVPKCEKTTNYSITLLGVRSLANASRARQFNPLNPPGMGWVILFYFF